MARAYERNDFFQKLSSSITGLPIDLRQQAERYKREPWTFFSEQCMTITDIDPPNGIFRNAKMVLFPAQVDMLQRLITFSDDGNDFFIDDTHIEKSRQQGLSWILCGAVGLWSITFWDNIRGLYLSRKEDEVDDGGENSTVESLFGKIRFQYDNMDEWLKQQYPLDFKFLYINNRARQSFLVGESANPNAGRGGTYKFAVVDEAAYVPNSEAVMMAVDQACKRGKILNSTPLGAGNHYARIKRMRTRNMDTGYKFIRLHWSQNPWQSKGLHIDPNTGRMTSPWYEKVIRTMTREAIARELEISYSASMSGLVYPEFNIDLDTPGTSEFDAKCDYSPFKGTVFCGWDFGLNDPTALVLFQKNELGGYDVFNELQMDGQPIENFVPYVRSWQETYQNDWVFYGDIAGNQREKVTGSSVIETLAMHGIQVQYKKQAVQDGIRIVRLMHQNRKCRVHSRCLTYIECKTNYHYPLDPVGKPREGIEIPYHDWSSHMMDAERYAIMGVFGEEDIDSADFWTGGATSVGESDWLSSDVDAVDVFGALL
jgi:hypothetical protein